MARNCEAIAQSAFPSDHQHLPVTTRQRDNAADGIPCKAGEGMVTCPAHRVTTCELETGVNLSPLFRIVVIQQLDRGGLLSTQFE